MGSLEIVQRAIAGGRVYDDLPPRIKNFITPNDWKTRVKDYCFQRGLAWATSLACTVMGQQEYYDELLRCYKLWMRLFPYHLSDYLCRVARITPFKYYLDMMITLLKDERSYDRVPNFTAADALSVMGIGRNEYISALNACKARRLMWRVNLNRESIVREQLPEVPTINPRLEPWWRVAVVNIGEVEYRELDVEELAHLKTAAIPVSATGVDIRVRDFQMDVLRGLLRKGLAYIEVPVEPYDRFAIPPLEGFVSNKTTDAGDTAADPLEALLYSVFVANSERMTVSELGQILGVDLDELKAAIGVASRLGFASRVTEAHQPTSPAMTVSGAHLYGGGNIGAHLYDRDSVGWSGADSEEAAAALYQDQRERSSQLEEGLITGVHGAGGGATRGVVGGGGGVAVVVDAEATGYLMMGALSPGLKRHSVTLFEGGRVAGEEVMQELVSELWSSYAAGQAFEGEMLHLTHYAAALATLLEAVRSSAGPGVPLELLRKESLAGLSPLAACKVLNHAYCAVLPISQLPAPVLPLSPLQPGPAYYGPTPEAVSPWMHLALYSAARCGPASYVFVCGQRMWRLPHPLDRCTHALLTPWDEDQDAGRGGRGHGTEGQMQLVESSFLLYTLNELLSRTAVLVQPLDCTEPGWSPDVVDVPLPLPPSPAEKTSAGAAAASAVRLGNPIGLEAGPVSSPLLSSTSATPITTWGSPVLVPGIRQGGGSPVHVALDPGLVAGLHKLGLATCVGHLRLIRTTALPEQHQPTEPELQPWLPDPTPCGGGGSVAAGRSSVSAVVKEGMSGCRADSVGTEAAATAARCGGGDGDGGAQWLPLRVDLGVPLYCLELCRAVCRAAQVAGFLSQEGRQTQLRCHKQLQAQLTKLLVQFSHCTQDGSYGSTPGPLVAVVTAGGDVGDESAAVAARGADNGSGWNIGSSSGVHTSVMGGAGRLAPVLPLPALNLSFDGRSLQPIRMQDSMQGLGCLCQG